MAHSTWCDTNQPKVVGNAFTQMCQLAIDNPSYRALYIVPHYKWHSFAFDLLKKECPHYMSEVTTAEGSYLMLQNLSFMQVIDSNRFNLLGNQSFNAVYIERCPDLPALHTTASMLLDPHGFVAVVDPDSYEVEGE